jgi:3-dehydroquinate synthase
MTHITVPVSLADRAYDIHIGEGILERAGELVPNLAGRKIFVLHDAAVKTHAARLFQSFPDGALVRALSIEGGEQSKSFASLQIVLDWLLANGVDRKSILFALGGGVIGDLGGFAASIVLRGIDVVQIPTTLLAQVDSSVGGKTGINAAQGKNLIGTFHQPIAVLCDTGTLSTLPEREMKAGYAEIVKYGALGSREFFEWLEDHGADVLSLRPDALADAIETSCRMKAEIVEEDEHEKSGGRRALLNLGHTFAHALEAAAGYDGRLLHGEAVSIGLVLAARLSARMGLAPAQDATRLENHLHALGLKTSITDITPALSHTPDDLIDLMGADKKAKGGKIGFILLRGIGTTFQSFDADMDDVRTVLYR